MATTWMEIFKPEIDQRISEHDNQRDLDRACQFVRDGGMTVDFAAHTVNLSISAFEAEMKKRGYKIPDSNMAMA